MAIDEALSLLGVVRANCCHLELGESPRIAPVAQGIEHRFPKPCAQVRILPGALPGAPICRGHQSDIGDWSRNVIYFMTCPTSALANGRSSIRQMLGWSRMI